MVLGANYQPNLIGLTLLGALTLTYLELSDGSCKLQENVLKFKEITKDSSYNTKLRIYETLNELVIKFVKTLGVFMVLTIAIAGILLTIFVSYPFVTPEFISENLEIQSIYAMLPVFLILFFVFSIIYLLKTNKNGLSEQRNQSNIYDNYY
jgi:hypothetical protein